MANPRGTPENLKPFPKGVSGNPGGMPKETAELIRTNAEKASRLRAKLLEQLEGFEKIELTADVLRALKDAEDRGYGQPKQQIGGDPENPVVHRIERKIVRPKNADD